MDAKEALKRIMNDPEFAHEKQMLLNRLDEGRRQLDEGEYVEFDDEGLHRYFEGLIARTQKLPTDTGHA